MDQNWNAAAELAHFEEIWTYRSPGHFVHTKEVWNERAHEWADELKNDADRRKRSEDRVAETAAYLRSKGILSGSDDVIDIGCGPGRFVAEFARTAHHAVGTDLSSQMLIYGAEYAKEVGVENTSYVEADFQQADIDALGWRNRFDLVFSSITPAINGMTGLEKMMQMSRGWCFNSCFVHTSDPLEEEMCETILGQDRVAWQSNHWHWFYALHNLLWLRGYYPETRYYREPACEMLTADRKTAEEYAKWLAQKSGRAAETLVEPVDAFLRAHADENGAVKHESECIYGWVLWNVTKKDRRF